MLSTKFAALEGNLLEFIIASYRWIFRKEVMALLSNLMCLIVLVFLIAFSIIVEPKPKAHPCGLIRYFFCVDFVINST